jgi:lipopolysaccharide assembly outer membrane protein LptD (OstA)
LICSTAFPQDSTKIITVTPQSTIDSLKAAYQREDSLKAASTEGEADTLIDYGGEKQILEMREEGSVITLFGKDNNLAYVNYKDMTLKAQKITIYEDSMMLYAEGIVDSSKASEHPDSVKYKGLPVFTQVGNEPMHGFKMVYNLKTRKGRVTQGRTKMQGGYYLGDNVVRVNRDILQIRDGKFTTCDKEQSPHFHFQGAQMRFKIKDKIVSKPVLLVIEDVPLFWLPFGVFPARGGRRSGILVPSWGSSQREGRFLRGFGYFFALSQYFDAKILGDYFDKFGATMFRGDFRYKKKYVLDGNISGSYTSPKMTGSERWDLRIRHSHIVDPTLRISAQGEFQSDKDFYKQFSLNREQRAKRRLYSALQISKNWEGTKNSMSINVSRDKDLTTDEESRTFPQIAFSRSSPTYLFKKDKKGTSGSGTKSKWYETINFRYQSNLLNTWSKKLTIQELDTTFTEKKGFGIEHTLRFSAPQKIFKYITFNPNINYKENWYDKYKRKFLDENGEEIEEDVNGFIARRTFRSSLALSTNIYGVFPVNLGPLQIIRHKFTPNISLNYTPDFSDEQFKYFDSYIDTTGEKVTYDKFEDVVIGGRTPQRRVRSLSISLNNLLQVKTVKGEDENKFDIFSLNFSTSYNFEAKDKKLGNLSTRFRLKKWANFDVSMSHSFYKYGETGETDEYLWKDGSFFNKRFLRLTNLRASIGFSKKGGVEKTETEETEEEIGTEEPGEDPSVISDEPEFEEDPQQRFESITGSGSLDTPWDLNANLNFTLSKNNPEKQPTKRFSANVNFNMQLTQNWKMSYSNNMDLRTKKIISSDFKFYRDLHCWELSFHWTPSGRMKGFYLVVRIKDPQFKDLKVEKRDYGGSSVITPFNN